LLDDPVLPASRFHPRNLREGVNRCRDRSLNRICQIDLLPRLFEKVVLPSAVEGQLMDAAWLEILEALGSDDADSVTLDEGDAAVIGLATAPHADLLLMDERKGMRAAEKRGFRVTGTLGVLDLAAERGLIDFGQTINKLERTSFRRPEMLLDSLRRKHAQG
jgi:predicted nucleic acid-binding protein